MVEFRNKRYLMTQEILTTIKISNFLGSNESKITRIFEQFESTDKIENMILEFTQEIYSLGIKDKKSLALQEDLLNLLIYYRQQNHDFKKIFEVLGGKKLISFFRKILKRQAKYYINLDKTIEKLIVKEEDELTKIKVKNFLIKKMGSDLKTEFVKELDEATNILTFLDNKKMENEEFLNILGLYLNIENLRNKFFIF